MVQDWLAVRGLDRARLAVLANNALQVEAYEEWMENKDKEVSTRVYIFVSDLYIHI